MAKTDSGLREKCKDWLDHRLFGYDAKGDFLEAFTSFVSARVREARLDETCYWAELIGDANLNSGSPTIRLHELLIHTQRRIAELSAPARMDALNPAQGMPKRYKGAVCKGSILLGSACGKCERCDEERAGLAAQGIQSVTCEECRDSIPVNSHGYHLLDAGTYVKCVAAQGAPEPPRCEPKLGEPGCKCDPEMGHLCKMHREAMAAPQLNSGETARVKKENAKRLFTEWFAENYPGPRTIITDPNWHAPKIFNAAVSCLREVELLAAPQPVDEKRG